VGEPQRLRAERLAAAVAPQVAARVDDRGSARVDRDSGAAGRMARAPVRRLSAHRDHPDPGGCEHIVYLEALPPGPKSGL
jgi:hypothetical protein